jgi:hypothetical protein
VSAVAWRARRRTYASRTTSGSISCRSSSSLSSLQHTPPRSSVCRAHLAGSGASAAADAALFSRDHTGGLLPGTEGSLPCFGSGTEGAPSDAEDSMIEELSGTRKRALDETSIGALLGSRGHTDSSAERATGGRFWVGARTFLTTSALSFRLGRSGRGLVRETKSGFPKMVPKVQHQSVENQLDRLDPASRMHNLPRVPCTLSFATGPAPNNRFPECGPWSRYLISFNRTHCLPRRARC